MRFKLSNNTYNYEDNSVKGDFEIVEEHGTCECFGTHEPIEYTTYYVVLNTLEDLMEFIKLNGTIYLTEDNTLGYGNFYIE